MGEHADNSEFAPATADYVASAAKAIVGAVPFAGSLLVEIAGVIIPNQRMDRVARFASELERQLAELEQEFVRSQLADEGFTDLMEEALWQAARSLSDDRREQIAHLVASSLSSDEISYIESQRLLRVAGELDDLEIIWLGWHSFRLPRLGLAYYEQHEAVLGPVAAHLGSSQGEVDRSTLRRNCDEHLAQLGLYDGEKLTPYGKLLARELGLPGVTSG